MKKKWISGVLSALCMATCLFGLSACRQHKHSFTNYLSDGNATYEMDGTKTAVCDKKRCKETHTVVDEGSKLTSQGLRYTLSQDGSYYIVKSKGICEDTAVYIPATYNNLPVKEIGDEAFRKETDVTKVVIPYGVTTIGADAFTFCSALTEIVIPDSVTTIKTGAFSSCLEIEKIVIPESAINLGDRLFGACANLKEVVLPSGLTKIGALMFTNCSELETVVIPDGVEIIDTMAFCDCISLKEIIIPNGVKTIQASAFYNCKALTELVVPGTVQNMGGSAFHGCENLTIYCEADVMPDGWSSDWNKENLPVVWGYQA